MALKWKEISLLLEEARPVLLGSAMQKIAQVREIAAGESFYFHGFGERGGWSLWTCLQQDNGCLVFAGDDWDLESQPEPSTFVMVLRKHLIGRKITGLEQVIGERIVLMHFDNGMSLLFELLPKRANLLLIESWDAEKRTARSVQSFRTISLAPGAIHSLPPAPPTLSEEVRTFGEPDKNAPFPFHQAVADKYWSLVQKTGLTSHKKLWRQAWKSHSRKVNSALDNVKKDFKEAEEAELFHRRGMALVAHLYELGPKKFPKEKKIELDGLEIPLDPAKNYADNSEACFKKSKKFNRAVGELAGRIETLEKKVSELAKVTEKIEKATNDEELDALAPEFEKEGLPLPEKSDGKEEKEQISAKPFLEFKSSDGFRILCGRNQAENRRVTFQEAKGNDLWLHAKGLPGAHVVVKGQKNKTIPLATLLEAAQLCLYHSNIRKGKSAEVDYTPRKNVRAIKGTIAEVTYTGNKTLYLDADPEVMKKLLS
ncbi:MAG: NFACT RNA binding domain-containing protein [Bdellovibrionota bacterium]